ncbi:MAG TPA: hypothetical protein VGA13_11385 [Acidimicrobiales bacterium]|jgi:hypothetical protein
MPVRPGEEWGEPGTLPSGGIVVRSDAEIGALLDDCRQRGGTPPVVGLLGGDLWRTLGGLNDEGRLRDGPAHVADIDVGQALLDGRLRHFVAHAVARRPWWWGRVRLAMNSEWLGHWDVAPRAHPGDGRLDVLDASVPLGDRLKVRSRLPTGSHLPHPAIGVTRTKAVQWHFDRPVGIWLDGVRAGSCRDVSIRLDPAALTVVV